MPIRKEKLDAIPYYRDAKKKTEEAGTGSSASSRSQTGGTTQSAASGKKAVIKREKLDAIPGYKDQTARNATSGYRSSERNNQAARQNYASRHPEETGGELGAIIRGLNSQSVYLNAGQKELEELPGRLGAEKDSSGKLVFSTQEDLDAYNGILNQYNQNLNAYNDYLSQYQHYTSADGIRERMDAAREKRDKASRDHSLLTQLETGGAQDAGLYGNADYTTAGEARDAYNRYDAEYKQLLNQYYYAENKGNLEAVWQDQALSSSYTGAKELQDDMDRIAVVADDAVNHNGGAEAAEARDYLFQKYGLTQQAIDNYAAGGQDYRPEGAGYTNLFQLYDELSARKEQAVKALGSSGYDYERMTGYEQMLQDAEEYSKKQERWTQWANEHPVLSSIDTLLFSPLQGADFLTKMAGNIGHNNENDPGRYVPMNVYNMDVTNYVDTVRGTVSRELEENTDWELFGQNMASFLYQTGMSVADSALQVGAAGMAGAPSAATLFMGASAASNQAKNVIERGGTNSQAFWGGLAAGAAEVIFEKVSIDSLLKEKNVDSILSWLRETAKQAGVEASEEMFTEIANILSDAAVMGENSDFAHSVDEYMAQGMSRDAAKKQAYLDCVGQVAWAGAGGALSGGMMGGTVNGMNAISYNADIRQSGSEFRAMGDDVVQAMIREGLYSDPSTRSYQLAQELQKRLDAGKPVTDRELGILYQENVRTIEEEESKKREQSGPDVDSTLLDAAREAVSRGTRATEGSSTRTTPEATALQDTQRIDQARKVASALGENGRKALKTVYDGQGDPDAFASGFADYYNAGVSGREISSVRSEYSVRLNQAQKFAAYAAGQNDAEVSLARERRAAQYAKVAGTDSGLVFDDYVADELDTAVAERVNIVAKALGVRVRFVDSVRGGTANAQVSGSDILVEKNNPNPVMFLLGHEWTHRMQELAPTEYRAFREAVAEEVQGEARVLLDQYRRAGENISYEAALDEAAANYAGRMIEDGKVLDDFIEKHRDNRTLLEKVRDAIRSIIAKLTGAERRQAQTAEGKLTAALEASAKQAVKLETNKNTAQDGGTVRYSTKSDVLALDNVDWMDNFSSIKAQLSKHAKEINVMDPVAVVEYSPKSSSRLTDAILGEVATIGGKNMKNGGISFTFDDAGVKSINAHAKTHELRAAALASPYVAKYGKLVAGQKNHENTGLTTLTYAAPVIINGTTVNVGVAIQFQSNGRPRAVNVGLQSGDVFKLDIKKAPKGLDSRVSRYGQGTSLPTMDASGIRIAQYEENVNQKSSMDGVLSEEFYDSTEKYSLKVTDKDTLDFLNNQETITTYKTMQLVDGKLYPPMASRIEGKFEDYSELGTWEQATEHPELIRNGKFKLDKGKGQGSIEAAYNPYMHSSNLVINDQFTGAYTRDNLVTVECEVPMSEMTSGYHAQHAKDSVGWHSWHTGTVAGQIRKEKGTERQVFLSRWIKPVRIVPDAEVALMYKDLLEGTDVAIPDNVVTPSLLAELKKIGVNIKESGRVKYSLKGSETARDIAAIQKENERLRVQVERWKGQLKQTTPETRTLRQGDVDKLALELVKRYDSTLKASDISADLKELGEFIIRGGDGKNELTWAGVHERALGIAKQIVDNAVVVDDEVYQQYSDLRSYLKSTRLNISDEDSRNITDYGDFRKRNMGRINLGKGSTNIDQVYREMSERWPEFFDEQRESDPVDQLFHIADVLDGLQPIYGNPYSYDMAAASEYVAGDIVDSLMGGDVRQAPPTYADKQARKLEEAKAKGRQQVQKVREQSSARLDELRKQNRQRVQDAIAKERDRRNERVQKLKEHYAEVRKNQAERRADSKARTRLLNIARRLQNKKLPAVSRALLDQYIGDLDTVSKSMTGKTLEKLSDLQAWYSDRKENDPDFISDPVIEKKLARLSKRQIADMTAEEVADLTDALLNIENELRNERKLIDTEDRRDTYHMGEETIDNIYNTKGSSRLLDKYIVTQTLSPVRQVRRMTGYVDSDPLYRMTEGLADGQRAMLDYQMKAERPFEKFASDKAFSRTFSGPKAESIQISGLTRDGIKTVSITPAMRTSLYLHSLNDQNLRHIKEGGITVPDEKLYRAGKLEEAYARGTTIKLTPSQVRSITAGMTEKEKAFARAAQRYFNETSRTAINETSEKLKGYSLAKVENYFPINTDSSFTRSDFESLKFDGTIEGMGFLKERVNAANPIMLRDANAVLEQAIQMHGKYVGLAIPVRNFNKVLGVTTASFSEDGSRNSFESSVQQAIKKQWGAEGYKYIEKMMTDLQGGGGNKNVWTKALNKLRSNYAGAVLTLNLSVAMKQAASYPTAAAVLGWRPLVKALGDFSKVNIDTVAKYTPLLWYRSKGFSTKELGDMKSANRQLPPLLNWVQGVDVATTKKLWRASEYYIRQNNKALTVGTDAYWRAVADIYNRVIEETQPNYTTMQRPQLLRTDDPLMSNLAMFKTQPFQNFNIVYDAACNFMAKAERAKTGGEQEKADVKKARTNLGHAITSQIAQLAVFAGMTMAWSLLRGRKDKYEDEDGDMTVQSVLTALGKDMVGGAFSGVPFGSDAWELLSSKVFGDAYYGMDTVTVTAISDTVQSFFAMAEQVGRIAKNAATGKDTDWNAERLKLDSELDDISKAAGIPYENVVNMFKIVCRSAAIASQGEYLGGYAYLKLTTDPKEHKSDYYDLLYKALTHGEYDNYDDIRGDLMEELGADGTEIDEAMRERYNKAVKKDPDYEIPNRSKDLIGIQDQYEVADKPDSFGADDLDAASYRLYSQRRADSYRAFVNSLEDSGGFQNLDNTAKNKALNSARNLAADMALRDSSAGQFTDADLSQWERWASGGADWGVDETEAILFKLAYEMAESDKDEDGKTISGSKKENTLEAVDDLMPWLTDLELEYLMSNYWTPEDRELKAMKENGFME